MPEEILQVEWCLWDGAEATDFLLCEGDWDILPELYQQDNIRFEYNQGNQVRSKVSCTIFAAMWMLSDLMNYEFTIDEIKEVDELSYNNPKYHIRHRWEWWYVKDAVDLVAKWWNEKHWDLGKVAYYRMTKYSDVVDSTLKKNYTLDTNFCPTVEYAKDYYVSDAVLDWYEFWYKTNWHSVDIIWDWHRAVKDSYKWRKTSDWKKDANIYELKHPLAKITNYWTYLYVYTKVSEDNYERVKELNEFKTLLVQTIENNSAMWHKTRDANYRKKLNEMNNANRKKLDDINEQLKLLS